MGLELLNLRVLATSGTPKEQTQAQKVLKLLERGSARFTALSNDPPADAESQSTLGPLCPPPQQRHRVRRPRPSSA